MIIVRVGKLFHPSINNNNNKKKAVQSFRKLARLFKWKNRTSIEEKRKNFKRLKIKLANIEYNIQFMLIYMYI